MLKTYNWEELKQLEGKRVRAEYKWEDNSIVIHIGELRINQGIHAYVWGFLVQYVNERSWSTPKYQFEELLENEFEIGEEVEVRDDNYEERDKMIFLGIVPRAIYKYAVVDADWESEYHGWSEVYCVHYRQIRKIQPKPEPKKMTMEELNKELWYEVEIVEKK